MFHVQVWHIKNVTMQIIITIKGEDLWILNFLNMDILKDPIKYKKNTTEINIFIMIINKCPIFYKRYNEFLDTCGLRHARGSCL